MKANPQNRGSSLASHPSDFEWPRSRVGEFIEGEVVDRWRIVECVAESDKRTLVRTKCTACGYYDRHAVYRHAQLITRPCPGCEARKIDAELTELEALCDDDGVLPEDRCVICARDISGRPNRVTCGPLCKARYHAAKRAAGRAAERLSK